MRRGTKHRKFLFIFCIILNTLGELVKSATTPDFIDDDVQIIYIADCWNHRILQYKTNAKHGEIAG